MRKTPSALTGHADEFALLWLVIVMHNSDNGGFVPNFRAAWQNAWPRLGGDVDSLVLVAFRVLVLYLEQHGFFNHPPSEEILRDNSKLPSNLITLLRTSNRIHLPGFVDYVTSLLRPRSLDQAAELASAIDREFGSRLSLNLGASNGGTVSHGLQDLTRAVNAANRVLMGELSGPRPIILVRPPDRYWSTRKDVVSAFPLTPQTPASHFMYLLPTETRLNRVRYSALGGMFPQNFVVALWPVEAPPFGSEAISEAIKMRTETNGRVPFCFKRWDDLPETHQEQQTTFANLIADHIQNGVPDAFDTVYVVAAPELTLAPESLESIVTAVETRRNAAWIVFPGSYHVERGGGVINRAPIYVGGVLDPADLTGDPLNAHPAAVKFTPVRLEIGSQAYVEDIDRSGSLTHLLDTGVGRIAVMICRDFLAENLRNEVVSMCADHLFVLSMSSDRGPKFEGAMDEASNYRTACFFVNAFKHVSRRAAHRVPLRRKRVVWMPPDHGEKHWVLVFEPE